LSNALLDEWLSRLEQRAPETRIDLGLERVSVVADRLFVGDDWENVSVITIGGTNGKGSTVAFCESIALEAGLTTVAYTSPHLLVFNERLRINGKMAEATTWLDALERVDVARADEALTWFEHVTLAALWIAKEHRPDLLLLEVGLGGRLDAVNVMEPDVAVITSIGLDHTDWLGPTRAHIGREKLGIARPGKPLIIGEPDWPEAAEEALVASGAEVSRLDQDFWVEPVIAASEGCWQLTLKEQSPITLPPLALMGRYQWTNAACAVLAIRATQVWDAKLGWAVSPGLSRARIEGRFERVQERPVVLLDVAHNPSGASALAGVLADETASRSHTGRTLAVFSALVDKDIRGIGEVMAPSIDHWIVGNLEGSRGQTAGSVAQQLRDCGVTVPIDTVESIPDALDRALALSTPTDRVVVFGSFHVLTAVRSRWTRQE
jgi:dihydrofolate synthase/folylpolyglutamate synthase